MGYSWKNRFLFDIVEEKIDGWKDKKIVELGAQLVKHGFCDTPGRKLGKDFFLEQGVREHVSIDNDPRCIGSIPIDLGKPSDKWINYFDILTDCGTGEHVDSQYNLFQNKHKWIRVGGITLNYLPIYNQPHPLEYSYSIEFFEKLAELCDYTNLELGTTDPRIQPNTYVYCISIKNKKNNFIIKTVWKKEINPFLGKRI